MTVSLCAVIAHSFESMGMSASELKVATTDAIHAEMAAIDYRLAHRPRVVGAMALGCMDGSCSVYKLVPKFAADQPVVSGDRSVLVVPPQHPLAVSLMVHPIL